MFLNWMKVGVIVSMCFLPLQSKAVSMRFSETVAEICEITVGTDGTNKGISFKGDSNADKHHVLVFNTNSATDTANINFELESKNPLSAKHSIDQDSFGAKKMVLEISKKTANSSHDIVIDTTVSNLSGSKQSGRLPSINTSDNIYVFLSAPQVDRIDLAKGKYEYMVTAELDCI